MLPRLWTTLLPLALLVTGCRGHIPFDGAVRLESIHNVPDSEDVLIAEFTSVEGVDPGWYAMKVPADWNSRQAKRRDGDFPVLVPAIQPEWERVDQDLKNWRVTGLSAESRIPWQFVRGDLSLKEASTMANARLLQGMDTYWLHAVEEEEGDPATWSLELLGARRADAGERFDAEPWVGGPDIEWVQLCDLEFVDARSGSVRRFQRIAGEVGAGTGLLVLVGGPLLVLALWLS